MDQLLPQASRVMNGAEGLPLIESAATSSKAAPIVCKQLAQASAAPVAADDATNAVFLDQNRSQRNAGLQEQDWQTHVHESLASIGDPSKALARWARNDRSLSTAAVS